MKLGGDRNQCQTCHKYFNSTHAFDKHRTGSHSNRRCLTTEEMEKKNMLINKAGFWIGEAMPSEVRNAISDDQSQGSTQVPTQQISA